MNVSRPRTDVKIHQVNIKTPIKLPKSSELPEPSERFELSKNSSSELSKIYSNSPRTSTNQILNEMNNSNSKYFESS